MKIKEELEISLSKIVSDLAEQEIEPQITIPNDLGKGDFTTNIAMQAFKIVKSNLGENFKSRNIPIKAANPMDMGEKIVEELRKDKELYSKFAKIELVNPGFINFYLSGDLISQDLSKAVKGFESTEAKSSLILEYGDLNPFKEPHIGHVRVLVLGEALARIWEFLGVKVIRANYEGDVGMHVAKTIWGIQKSGEFEKISAEDLEIRAKYLGKCYSEGAKAFEESEEAKQEIVSINNKVYSKDSEIEEIWKKGREWSLEYFETLYKRLGVKYTKYYFESETAGRGKEIVETHPEVFEKDDGAYIYRGEKVGLHTRVFINKEGNPTYEAKDLGLAFAKDKDFPDIEKSIIMTANEQTEYFKVLLKALSEIDEKLSRKTEHLSFGFVDLKEGKMSSRSGNIVSGFWLLDETKKRLKEGFKDVPDSVAEDLAVGSVKWSMLKFSRSSSIKFSIEESIDLAGSSAPYMQYTFARICSIFDKTIKKDFEAKSVKTDDHLLLALGRLVCQFESVVKSSSDNLSPNFLVDYLFILAQNFNSFYEKEKIIGNPKEEEILPVVFAVKNVIEKGLNLLGINAPEKI